ncbi:hypothetical protein DFA_11471 [Cavenderia fasciculata]|uniref:Ankyrin repeat-containing protein n=1 Tax=Cavenderia fasciculata TaxID=261658 RepID=F4QD29_CACFS|nr:uncharacterized protein DFA_11471 [Cavenderia fasciculata]EGG13710.1 hypothetical protein DFA_11471 [Cavenderia fasciculata]|eukprot:XP_004350414.1 hypothetical protein DFA_11471 [Cavenderia fasciculata]
MAKDVWRAARKGDIKKIKKYIPSVVKVDTLDKENKTALHHSIDGDQLEIMTYLIENGANINLKDPKGDTPLIMSLRKISTNEKQEDLAIQLIIKGADYNIDAKDRKTPERIVEALPKRFQVKYKEALQSRLAIKRPTMVSSNPPPPTITNNNNSVNNLAGSLNSITVSSNNQAPSIVPVQPVQPNTLDPNHQGTNITPISPPSMKPQTTIITTVPNRPITTTSGNTYQRAVVLDVVPRSIFPSEDFSGVKDANMLWLEVTYKLSIVALCSDKVRYDDITKAIDECGNVLVHFLALIGDRETTAFMDTTRNQDAVTAIHERVKSVKDGIKLRLFSRIEHSELIRLVAALSAENLISLGRIIAEQLASVKSTTTAMVPSKVSGHLEPETEKEIIDGASRQLRGTIDFYKSNVGSHTSSGMPCEGVVLPLLASIQKSIHSLSIYSSVERDVQMVIPAQLIAQDVNSIRSILLEFQNDPSANNLSEELSDQLMTTIECCCHFATKLLFSIAAVISHNRLLDMSQVGFSCRALASCCCILLDSFCF